MNINQQVTYLMRGVDYGDPATFEVMKKELRASLIEADRTGKPLRVYCGYDPRTSDLHIGHTVTMRKLRQFQELGHQAIFLIGTYTALIGDPSDKDKLRPQLTPEEAKINAETYAEQAFRILDKEKTEIRYNAEWLSKLDFGELIHLASNFTLQQFLSRENFRKRWDGEEPIYFHEFFYALMQGYDAYALEADVQVGGTDQVFNIITAARKIMTYLKAKPNIGIILPILPGTDGVLKMSKSLGNHIPLNTTPEDMFGKVMSVPDTAMPSYSRLVTRWSVDKIERFERDIDSGEIHPRDAKMELAEEITAAFFDEEKAQHARQEFINMFQKGELPDYIPDFKPHGEPLLLEILVDSGLATSKSQARRLIEQNGVKIDGKAVGDPYLQVNPDAIIQVGKRHFIRIIN
ncbi:MAG: tyrosine--tRNA ligase [Brevefilum fermentans]|uniref:Tyrosine--tRNA ligase n=1 Tax=Candidatus Brevifilum fermentans TaxID=1986204 RepID=A0A1Y6K6V3_9CHLR|nr:tyrosine--tRNA ligase [Brevefilum fermentans]MDI9566942.1 tyrosine--tRNA ligase [Chloroflexota bacterium]SMX54587.1 Tyrosine--tRNA ligase [Brevefilum fermentans]HOM67127.1 tyrosine--tRNA ligase [Brevefilum fermentans]HPX95758.1 tyrosine--tRNA ligase [Brevefilum fermentans]